MKLFLEVEQFGRIESAKVCLTGFTIFVGDNNSGKTYIMQLAHGILQYLPTILLDATNASEIPNASSYTLNPEALHGLLDKINHTLSSSKQDIIRHIFGADIPIQKLAISIEDFNNTYRILAEISPDSTRTFYTLTSGGRIFTTQFATEVSVPREQGFAYCVTALFLSEGLHLSELNNPLECNSIYLPSSRSGMLLLYRQFFANSGLPKMIVNEAPKTAPVDINLPKPLLDFLTFLQTYKPSGVEKNTALLHFLYENLADGTISMGTNEMQYQPHGLNFQLQMPLCSSLINELTPLVQVLTSNREYSYIMYDEVETCLHPTKQIQMARLLIRLVNRGKNLLVSTHSDTMAMALNNLFLLSCSQSVNRAELLQQLGYTTDDLLKTVMPRVYQFSREGDTTTVAELPMSLNPNTGFKFDQFWKSGEKIYADASAIMGVNS